MLNYIEVKKEILKDEKYNTLFSVEEVNKEVANGTSFRDAYKKIASKIETGKFHTSKQINHTHEGSMGNLCNDKIVSKFNSLAGKIF